MSRWTIVALAVVIVSTVAFGQAQTTGQIAGMVVDDAGRPVVEARIVLVSPAMQGERTTRTDARGQFLAALLPVGPYAVTMAAPGKKTVQVSLRVAVGQTDPLHVTLENGETKTETVTVYGQQSPLETTIIGENFDYDRQIEELPIPDRDIPSIALLGPNINGNQGFGYVSISGSAANESSWLLDGAEITDNQRFLTPELYVEDAIEEVQLQTAGVSARYGRFMGGVVNAVTKTGGNEFGGTFRAQFTNESWNSATPFGEEQADQVNQIYQATLGGYALKDHLWFFLAGLTRPTDTINGRTSGTLDSYSATIDETRWQAKLRGAVTPNHVIEVNYLDYSFDVDGLDTDSVCCLAGDALATTGGGRFPREIATLSYQGILSSKTFVEVIASRKEVVSARGGNLEQGSPFVDLSANPADSATYVSYHNNVQDPNDAISRNNETLGAHVTHVFSTERAGTHTLQGGVQYVNSISDGAGKFSLTNKTLAFVDGVTPFAVVNSMTGEVTFNVNSALTDGDQINLRLDDLPLLDDQEVENYALYAHDTWGFGRWRVDLGLRWENYRTNHPSGSLDLDADALAPRAALTYSFTPTWQIQTSYGKYVGRMDDFLIGNQTGVGASPQVQNIYEGPAFSGLDYDQVEALLQDDSLWAPTGINNPETPTSFISEDAELPYSLDFNLSMKWGLPRNRGTATVSYIHRDYRNIWDGFIGGQGTQIVPVPGRDAEFPFDTTIWTDADQAERTYQAIVLAGEYRPSRRWDIGGNFTFSELEGNIDQFEFSIGGSGSAIGAYPRSRSDSAAVPTGRLLDDMRYRLNTWANYRLDLGPGTLALGALGRYRSGTTWSRTDEVFFDADPQGEYVNETGETYTYFLDGRGNNEFDSWWSLDLSARYQFRIYKRLDAWAKATVTNVVNNSAQIRFDTSGSGDFSDPSNPVWVPSSTFGQAVSSDDFQVPRAYQFTLGLAF